MKYQIGATVQYQYSETELRTGKVVEYNAELNRYRVFWHTATSSRNPAWKSTPNRRTWVKEDALIEVKI